MMVIFTSRLFDIAHSPLVIKNIATSSELRTSERRLSRSATLDGGAVIDDAGFADGDRTLTIVVQSPSEAQRAGLQFLMESDGLQHLATTDGLFEGGIERLSEQGGSQLGVRFLVGRKLSA